MSSADDRREAVAMLRGAGVSWTHAEAIANQYSLAAIRSQIEWLPLRENVRDVSAFLAAAIEKSYPAPTIETHAVARGVDYTAQASVGYRLSIEQRKYFDAASELHTHVVTALEVLADFEQAQHMRYAAEMVAQRWPNLERFSRAYPMALDRALAERLNIDVRGVATRLIMPPAPFGEVDYRDPNRKIIEPKAVTHIAARPLRGPGPKKIGQLIPGPSVHQIDAPVHEPVVDYPHELPAYEDAQVPV